MSENKHSSLDRLGLWILGATVLGAVTGLILGKDAQMFAPLGNLFMQLIKMITEMNVVSITMEQRVQQVMVRKVKASLRILITSSLSGQQVVQVHVSMLIL